MTLSDVCIQRPILTWMMILALIVFGVLGYNRLGVDQFPSMDFPVLSVTAVLEGASPEGIEEDVTDVLEEQLNTIAGVRTIWSTSAEGAAQITVEFELGTDLDVVVQDVRDKVAMARMGLPVDLEPPVVGKFSVDDSPVLWIPIQSKRSPVETSEYVRRQMNPYLETIPGVAGVAMFGRRDRNIRIWLDGDALGARGLAAGDVLDAIRREHVADAVAPKRTAFEYDRAGDGRKRLDDECIAADFELFRTHEALNTRLAGGVYDGDLTGEIGNDDVVGRGRRAIEIPVCG